MACTLKGLPVSPGMALAPALSLPSLEAPPAFPPAGSSAEVELERMHHAQTSVLQCLQQYRQELMKSPKNSEEKQALLEAQAIMVEDESFQKELEAYITERKSSAEEAVHQVLGRTIKMISEKQDAYLRARALDFQGLEIYLSRALEGKPILGPLSQLKAPVILITEALTAAETALLDPEKVLGIVSEKGGRSSHGAILARSLGIPALLNVSTATQQIKSGEMLFLDAEEGVVYYQLTPEELEEKRKKRTHYDETLKIYQSLRDQPALSEDGKALPLYANLAHPKEAEMARQEGVEGVGLFRTEFLFMNRNQPPGEEEQYEAYQAILEAFPDKKVVIRSIDIGGDKPIPYLNLPKEANPFLGVRAIRLCFTHPELFKTQLRALLRAAATPKSRPHLMLPMIVSVEEVRKAKQFLKEALEELEKQGQPHAPGLPLGIMIETPAAVLSADLLAQEVDFFSIGSNDLTQYLMAADRTHEQLSELHNPFSPALIRALAQVVAAAHAHKIWVGLCGEIGSDLRLLPLLLGLEIDELSMAPAMTTRVKQRLSTTSYQRSRERIQQALSCSTAEEIAQLFRQGAE